MAIATKRLFRCCWDCRAVLLLLFVAVQLGCWWLWVVRFVGVKSAEDGRSLYANRRLQIADALESGARGQVPPAIKSRVAGHVTNYVWRDEGTMHEICPKLLAYRNSWGNMGRPEPLLIRQAVNWTAMQMWNFTWMADLNVLVYVSVSPNFKFYSYDSEKFLEFVKRWGNESAPTVVIEMQSKEAIMRMQNNTKYRPLFFPEGEQYCLQMDLDDDRLRNVNLDDGPFSCLSHATTGMPWNPSDYHLWMSPQGAISPLHFEKSHNCIVQIRGTKRVLLYDKSDVDALYPYADDHMLQHGCRVDPSNPDYRAYPKFRSISATEAVVEPGDLLCFPANWPHHMESRTVSVSFVVKF